MIPYLFLLLGLLLLFLEFYTPGGLFAVAALAVLLIGIVTFVTENSPAASVFFVILTGVGVAITVKLALKRIKKSGSDNTFYLSKDQEGYQATQYDRAQIGKEGISLSDLGPSGYIVVDGKRFAATAKTGYLDKGTKVLVIGGEGSQLIVKAVL